MRTAAWTNRPAFFSGWQVRHVAGLMSFGSMKGCSIGSSAQAPKGNTREKKISVAPLFRAVRAKQLRWRGLLAPCAWGTGIQASLKLRLTWWTRACGSAAWCAERLCLSERGACWRATSGQAGRLSLPACPEEQGTSGLDRKAVGFPQSGAAEPRSGPAPHTAAGILADADGGSTRVKNPTVGFV